MSSNSSDVLQPRVVLRPLATPLPLGFLGLFAATLSISSLQLGWIAETEGSTVALGILVLTVPVQLVACVMGFLARDPVAATGMGILAGTWAAVTLVTLTSPAGAASAGLGVILLASAAAMLVPAVAGHAKVAASAVMALSAGRFAVTGIAEVTGERVWTTAAGWTGIALAVVAFYAALAFELEGTSGHAVLPVLRRGRAAAAVVSSAPALSTLGEVQREPGVRRQL